MVTEQQKARLDQDYNAAAIRVAKKRAVERASAAKIARADREAKEGAYATERQRLLDAFGLSVVTGRAGSEMITLMPEDCA